MTAGLSGGGSLTQKRLSFTFGVYVVTWLISEGTVQESASFVTSSWSIKE